MIEWIVRETDAGSVLAFLEQKLPAAPLSYLRQLLRAGKVRHRLEALAAEDPLLPGDRVTLAESTRLRELLTAPPPAQLDILYETRELMVIHKPAGLAIHRGKGHEEDNLQGRLEALMQARKAPFAVAPVHRLDLETSGPVLFAKGRQAAARLGQLFLTGQVDKRYLALVAGALTGNGWLSTPVLAKGKIKEAATEFHGLAVERQLSLLELKLYSGRTHQIRQQLATGNHPLAGDRRYGGPMPSELPRMFLHCCRLTLPDPFGGPPLDINCPLPDDLANFLRHGYPKLWASLQREKNVFP